MVGGTNGIGEAIANAATGDGARVEVDGRRTGLDVRHYDAVAAHVAAAAASASVASTMSSARPACCGSDGRRTLSPADLAEVIDVNVAGSLNVARAAYEWLRESRGSLTLFASSSFTLGRPNYVAYSASKAAVVNLAQGLAEEWAEDGIRVERGEPGADRHADAPARHFRANRRSACSRPRCRRGDPSPSALRPDRARSSTCAATTGSHQVPPLTRPPRQA